MASKVLLVSINCCDSPYPVFPLGVCHVASALRDAGHEAAIHDLNVDAAGLEPRIRSFQPDYVGLSLRNIDDVAIDTATFFAPALADVAERIRSASRAKIVAGGSGFSLFPAQLLELAQADYGVIGEGEFTFVRFLDALEKDASFDELPGLVFREKGSVVVNPMCGSSADSITLPDRPRELVEYYTRTSSMINVQTQRGCAFKCCYCTYPLIEGKRFRRRSAQSVCDDFEAGLDAGGEYFFVVDSVFNTSQEHVVSICEEILRRNLKIDWGCFLRPKGVTAKLMELMARAGLQHVEFGSDSFCDSVLDAYGKDVTFEDIFEASENARKNNVRYAHFLIIGGPGETEDTLREGFENSRRLKRTVVFPYVGMRIYPGTPLFQTALAQGVITPETDLLPPTFYVSPHIKKSRIDQLLGEMSENAVNWVVGEIPETLVNVMNSLRTKGVRGPLWEFLAR